MCVSGDVGEDNYWGDWVLRGGREGELAWYRDEFLVVWGRRRGGRCLIDG